MLFSSLSSTHLDSSLCRSTNSENLKIKMLTFFFWWFIEDVTSVCFHQTPHRWLSLSWSSHCLQDSHKEALWTGNVSHLLHIYEKAAANEGVASPLSPPCWSSMWCCHTSSSRCYSLYSESTCIWGVLQSVYVYFSNCISSLAILFIVRAPLHRQLVSLYHFVHWVDR